MNKEKLLKELQEIFDGVEMDRFTQENIYRLIQKIKKEGLKI